MKTQRKYAKLFESYVLSLARSTSFSVSDKTELFDRIFGDYSKNVENLEKVTTSEQISSSYTFSLLYYETKNNLSLLHRMTKIETFEKVLQENRRDSLPKIVENVVKTLKAMTRGDKMKQNFESLWSGVDKFESEKRQDKIRYVGLSNSLELIYKSLLLLLVYVQTLNAKKNKYITTIRGADAVKEEQDGVIISVNQSHESKL